MVENHKVVAEVVAVFQKSLQKLTSEKFCITIIFNRLHRFLFKRSLQNTLQIFKTHCVFPSPPRQGVPPPAKRLSCGRQCSGLPFRYAHGSYLSVVSAPLTPLRAAVPVACSHRLGGSTSCLSRQPHKACCCHSPLRSLTGVAIANELPQLLLRSAARRLPSAPTGRQ